jgi:hypothetical protein
MSQFQTLDRQSELETARRQTLAAAVISLFGDAAGAVVTTVMHADKTGNLLRMAHGLLALGVVIVLLARPRLALRWVLVLFTALVVTVLPLLVVWTQAVPQAQLSEGFIAYKMVIMGLALLTPHSLVLGLVLTLVVTIEAVALWWLGMAGTVPSEPWVTIFYSLFAFGLLLHRESERRMARKLFRANSEAAALERIARVTLDVRDRVNSPLQTLEAGLALLHRRCSSEAPMVARLQAAVARLTSLSRQLDTDKR